MQLRMWTTAAPMDGTIRPHPMTTVRLSNQETQRMTTEEAKRSSVIEIVHYRQLEWMNKAKRMISHKHSTGKDGPRKWKNRSKPHMRSADVKQQILEEKRQVVRYDC